MIETPRIETPRLLLRRWRAEDLAPFAALNADPEVTRYVGGPMTREASDAMVGRFEAGFGERGYSRWAVELGGRLVGFCGLGLHPVVPGDVEIGWRLARDVWGQGVATEAAVAVRDWAVGSGVLGRVVAVVHPDNAASIRVAEKTGLAYERDADLDGLRVLVYGLTRA